MTLHPPPSTLHLRICRPASRHCEGNAAAGIEEAAYAQSAGPDGAHDIVQHTVDHRLVETGVRTVTEQIEFERLAFQAQLVGHVLDLDPSKVGLSCNGTQAGEFRTVEVDQIVPPRIAV